MERQFVESMKRLYVNGKVDKEKIMELRKNGKLTIDEINFILESR